ncbi:MAG: hypothetical protein KY475_01490 [Planctomycetes bacterium]|nr:hypothetical protein [Planctomycetota bacterium]
MFFKKSAQRVAGAKQEFREDRGPLEEQFLHAAAETGRPRGLRWVQCDFHGEPEFAHDPASNTLQALLGVSIGFEAIEGGGMEDVEAVGNIRAATAVFRYDEDRWTTDGRAVFNLDPQETIAHFGLAPVEAT